MKNVDLFSNFKTVININKINSSNENNNFADIFKTSQKAKLNNVEASKTKQINKIKNKDSIGNKSKNDLNSKSILSKKSNNIEEVSIDKMDSEETNTEKNITIDTKPSKIKKDENNINENQMVIDICNILNITEQDILIILEQLNMTPEQLLNNSELIEVLQIHFEVKTPEELLNIPNISNILKYIKAITLTSETIMLPIEDIEPFEFLEVEKITSTQIKEQNTKEIQPQTIQLLTDELEIEKNNTVKNNEIDLVKVKTDEAELNLEQNFKNNQDSNEQNHSSKNSETKLTSEVEEPSLGKKNIVNNSIEVDELLENENIEFINTSQNKEINYQKSAISSQDKTNMSKQNVNDVINQLNQKLKFEFKGDTSEIRVRLNPQHLGDVTLKIATLNGIITAQFTAENERIKEIIESNFKTLKDSLEEQGIEIGSLSVSVGQEDTTGNMEQFLQEKQKTMIRANNIANKIINEEELVESPIESDLLESNVNLMI